MKKNLSILMWMIVASNLLSIFGLPTTPSTTSHPINDNIPSWCDNSRSHDNEGKIMCERCEACGADLVHDSDTWASCKCPNGCGKGCGMCE